MKRVFDLEQDILKAWSIVDDLTDILKDDAILADTERVKYMLLGLVLVYDLKFDNMFKTFSDMVRENHED